jgi:hypoxanthine phosphoribosyltransferase
MTELISVLKENEIKASVAQIARRISTDYVNEELVLIGVLKGAFIFLADLIRELTIPVSIDFVGTSSYGANTCSSGKIFLTKEVSADLKNKHVLIVEDIVDTGLTMVFLMNYLKSLGPKTVKICTLIDKPERREANVDIDYACLAVPNGFLVGYGLDYNEGYRGLPGIYHLKF